MTITHANRDAIDIEYATSPTLDDIVATSNGANGMFVSNVASVTVSDSVFSNNGDSGTYARAFLTDAAPSSTFVSDITLTSVAARYNAAYGIQAYASSSSSASFDITITVSTFSYNDDNGLVVDNPWDFSEVTLTPSVTITDSDFSHNAGSGIHVEYGRDVTLDGVTASYNSHYGVYIDYSLTVAVMDSTFNEDDYDGLKVWTSSGEDRSATTVDGVTADGNGDSGLGLDGATISVNNSTVSGNANGMDLDAKGIVDRSITVTNSTVSDSASDGIATYGSPLRVINPTITGSGQNGIPLEASYTDCDGSTTAVPSNLVLSHSTVTGNDGHAVSANANAYIDNEGPEPLPAGQDITIHHSIVSGNGDTDVSNDSESNTAPDQGTTTVSWSLVDSDSSFAGGNNIAADNPQLGALADNGGDTRTMLPLSGSPAINAGNPSVSGAPATDQRGETRLFGVAIDIGAVETDVLGSTATTTTTTPTTTVPSGGVLPPTGGGDRNGLAAGAAALLIGLGAAMSRLTRRRTA